MPEILNDDGRSGNPRAASVRIGSNTVSGYGSQRRHDLRIGPQPQYVDQDRAHLNRTLIDYPGPAAMREIARDRRAVRETDRAMKSNAAVATAGVITFGSEAAQMFEQLTPDQQDQALRELAEAVAERLNTSLHGLVVHLDEATIHAHFTLSAYDHDGHPLSKTTRPAILSGLQDLTAEVMGRHCPGIERGRRYGDRLAAGADFADVVHRSVRELHRDLPRDLEVKRAKLAELAAAEAEAQGRVNEMRDRVVQLRQRGELTVKEVKRLATYEKRLTDRLAELKGAQGAAETARTEADRLAELARADRVEQERQAVAVRGAVSALASEIEAGTIRQDENGKIVARDPSALRPALPVLAPAIRSVATARTKIEAEGAAAAAEAKRLTAERTAVMDERREVQELEAQLESWADQLREGHRILGRVVGWLGRKLGVELPREMGAALTVIEDAARPRMQVMAVEEPRHDVDRPNMRMASAAPEKPVEKSASADGADFRPGF